MSNNQGPLLDHRAATVFLLAILTGIGAGVCTVGAGNGVPAAVLAGGAAFGAAVVFFHSIIG